ncbi:MAG: ABC transporter substrate-binding protein [Burkholderiales bacterium]|nr:ABC transporter substrate-binding protein [Burkholderiales bacterium]
MQPTIYSARRTMLARALTLAVAPLGAGMAGAAVPLQPIEVIVFAGANAMPSYVAQDKGFFAREGLAVNITATPNSGFQISSLVAGKFHIASTAIDNLIAYQEGQGTAKLDREPDMVAFMGISSAELSLFALPEIRTIADLKGRDLALDSLSTGYAFVLRYMLEKGGLGPADFRFVAVGNSRARLQSLRDGKFAAALITEPFTGVARQEGFTLLGEGVSALGGYQANVRIVNRAWARDNPKAMVGYIRALRSAIDWIYDPANRDEAARILAGRVKVSEAAALGSVDAMTRGPSALQRSGEMDMQGLRNVIMLRERYGVPQKKMGPPSKYYDSTWYEQARARP